MKKVKIFFLENDAERVLYEALVNDPEVKVLEEKFAYVGKGYPKVTVFYLDESED